MDELQDELRRFINNTPDFQRTKVRQLFDSHRYELIYTPAYTPTTQPIELMWGYIKNYAATKYYNGRNLTVLKEQTLAGCYGNPSDGHEGVTSARCMSFINNRHEWCNQFIAQDSMLSGDIVHLAGNEDMDYSSYDIADDEQQEADPFAGDIWDDEEIEL